MTTDLPLKATVQHLNTLFGDALAGGEFAALGAMYADDAVLLPNEVATLIGRDAILAFWRRYPARRLSFETTRAVNLGGELVREFGRLHLHEGEGRSRPQFRYLTIWRAKDSGWRIASCMWNRLAPVQVAQEDRAVALDQNGKPIAYVPRVK